MKLVYRITLRIGVLLIVLLALWLPYFYYTTVNELYDEIDDALELQAQKITHWFIENDSLPNSQMGDVGNNKFSIEKVSDSYAQNHQQTKFFDKVVYIDDLKDEEPSRVISCIFSNKGVFYELQVMTPAFDRRDVLEVMITNTFILFVLLVAAILILVAIVVYFSMKPMYKLLNWIRNHKVGDEIPIDHGPKLKTSEFEAIKEAVMSSAFRSNALFEEQKRFIGNASHEIQTPLAVCKNRLELLIDTTELSELQLEEIGKTLNTIDHISKLNKSLLLISKIDNKQFVEKSSVDIAAIVQKQVDDLLEIYSYKNLKLTMNGNTNLEVNMNPVLAVSLVSNLLKNAFAHNVESGSIEINITKKTLQIKNTGLAQALDTAIIFDHFYKSDNSEGSGLGLAIAHAICQQSGFELHYHYDDGWHSFSVHF